MHKRYLFYFTTIFPDNQPHMNEYLLFYLCGHFHRPHLRTRLYLGSCNRFGRFPALVFIKIIQLP